MRTHEKYLTEILPRQGTPFRGGSGSTLPRMPDVDNIADVANWAAEVNEHIDTRDYATDGEVRESMKYVKKIEKAARALIVAMKGYDKFAKDFRE